MTLIDRYLFRQFLWPALIASAALIALGVLSQSLSTLGVLIDERQSVLIFAKLILLALPQLIVLILPVAILVASLISLSRMRGDQEIAILYGAGVSRWRVIAPALELSALFTIISLALSLWVQPLCFREMRDTLDQVRADLAATLIRPGQFTHPAPGITLYAQSVDDDGDIHNLFVDKLARDGRDITITARDGKLERRGGSPMLVMRQGANQEFTATGVLNFLSFDEYVVDLRPLMALDQAVRYKISDRYPHELFFPEAGDSWARENADRLIAEGHARITGPLYNVTFMALALGGVLSGGASRFGVSGRMAAAAAAALALRTLGFAAQAAAAASPIMNLAQYLAPLFGLAVAGVLIFGPVQRRTVEARA